MHNGLAGIQSRFNSVSDARLFSVFEEIATGEGQAMENQLKYVADSRTIKIEKKHLDPELTDDRRFIVLLSNYKNALPRKLVRKLFSIEVR